MAVCSPLERIRNSGVAPVAVHRTRHAAESDALMVPRGGLLLTAPRELRHPCGAYGDTSSACRNTAIIARRTRYPDVGSSSAQATQRS
jgi:hypothetical protein